MEMLGAVAFLSWGDRKVEIDSDIIGKLVKLLHDEVKEMPLTEKTSNRMSLITQLDMIRRDMVDWLPKEVPHYGTETESLLEIVPLTPRGDGQMETINLFPLLGVTDPSTDIAAVEIDSIDLSFQNGKQIVFGSPTDCVNERRFLRFDHRCSMEAEVVELRASINLQVGSMTLWTSDNIKKITLRVITHQMRSTVRVGGVDMQVDDVNRIIGNSTALANLIRLANGMAAIRNGQDIPMPGLKSD